MGVADTSFCGETGLLGVAAGAVEVRDAASTSVGVTAGDLPVGAGVAGIISSSGGGGGPVTDGAGLTWMLGLPVAHVTNDLTLKLACENSNGQTLFEKPYSATPYHV